MSFRNFSDESEALATRWANLVTTEDHWTFVRKVSEALGVGDTESSPWLAQCGPIQCVAKPGTPNKPRAAIEKIVSDLAFHLGLPVSPTILWNRGEGDPRHFALIAWAFEPFLVWDKAVGLLTEEEKNALIPVFSAIKAFEMWISADDRGSKHSLVYVADKKCGPQVAFIDYAYSLCHHWNQDDHPNTKNRAFMPMAEDRGAICQVVERIAQLDEGTVNQVVNRIPEDFLPSDKRGFVVQNLLSRRHRLPQMLKI